MRRFLVVGPNGGASFGQGGGSYVAMRIVETLSQIENSEVGLISLLGVRPDTLANSFGIRLPLSRIRSFFLFEGKGPREPSMNTVASPYIGAILLSFTQLLRRTIERFNPELIVFNDDTPAFAPKLRSERESLLYANFPYACRLRHGDPDSEGKLRVRRASEIFARPFMKRFFETETASVDWLVANSTVTRRYMESTFRPRDIAVLFPPVAPVPGGVEKTNLIVSVGAIQPNKRHSDLIEALSNVKQKCQCMIVGHLRDINYYRYLRHTVGKLGLRDKIRIVPDAPREGLVQLLTRSKIIVHPSRFEPFGISVVEGMTAGAVPIVYEGHDSGPWVDILAGGKYGLGFRTSEDLAEKIDHVIENEALRTEYMAKAKERADFFSPRVFSDRLLNLIAEK